MSESDKETFEATVKRLLEEEAESSGGWLTFEPEGVPESMEPNTGRHLSLYGRDGGLFFVFAEDRIVCALGGRTPTLLKEQGHLVSQEDQTDAFVRSKIEQLKYLLQSNE